jgi:ABC-2 type transport system ATP-binding protein
VRQNLEFWAVVYNVEPGQRQQRMDELLHFLGLAEYADFWPMSISAGMRQRLAIARSLLVQNPILFLDEPTVKLDAGGAQAVRDFIRRINSQFGITVLLTTHLIFEAEELCDRVAIMDAGRIVSCDSVANLRKHLQQYDSCAIACDPLPPDVQRRIRNQAGVVSCDFLESGFTFAAENLEQVLFATLKLLRGNNIAIHGVETRRPTLEDVFVQMTRTED